MTRRNHRIFSVILITSFIGISPAWSWIVKDRRYDGYDLDKGPVFYEAYYPENNENDPNEYQEKRYFDRDAVLERTFQVPTDRREYVEERSKSEYPNGLERTRYNGEYLVDPKLSRRDDLETEENYVKLEPSRQRDNLARSYTINRIPSTYVEQTRESPREYSLPRDFEPWNAYENYLHFERNHERRRNFDKSDIDESSYFRTIPERDLLRSEIFERRNDDGEAKEPIREMRKDLSVAPPRAIRPLELDKDFETMRRLSTRDVQDRTPFEPIDTIGYPRYTRQEYRYFGNTNGERESSDPHGWMSDVKSLSNQRMEPMPRNIDPLPSENIFAPRPQVINYVFSKNSPVDSKEKPTTATLTTSMNEVTKDEEPRKYGDNLLQEELKKMEEEKDKSAKVTSIEISEVPRHKIRHHHGEWLRDFSRGQK